MDWQNSLESAPRKELLKILKDIDAFALLTVLILWFRRGFSSVQPEVKVKNRCSIELDAPPMIRRMVPFPITVTVINSGQDRSVKLNKIKVKSSGVVHNNVQAALELAPVDNSYNRWTSQLERFKSGLYFDPLEAKASRIKALKGMENFKVQIDPLKFFDKKKDALVLHIEIEIEHIDRVETYTLKKSINVLSSLEKPSAPPGIYSGDWYYGDTHCHSTYTWDYYFGNGIYTISELKSLAIATGLDWLAITDHNYNLNESKYDAIKSEPTAL